MESSNIIFSFLLIVFGYFFNMYFLKILKKSKSNLLIDDQFKKPQAFHQTSTYRIGGITTFILLCIIFLYLYYTKNIFYFEFISFCTLFFILGLLDDLIIFIRPKFRLLIMIAFLVFLITFNQFYITKISLELINF